MLNTATTTTTGGAGDAGAGGEFVHHHQQQQQQLVMGEILDYKDGSLVNGEATDNHHNYATANAIVGGDGSEHYQQQQHLYQRIPGGEYQPSIKNEAL